MEFDVATQKLGRRMLQTVGIVTKPTIIYDIDLKGFGLKVLPPSDKNPDGSKSWIVEYRPGSGGRGVAKKRVVLGPVGSLSPEQARDAAKTMLANVRLGADPSASRAERRGAKTVSELANLYSAETDPVLKPRTVTTYRNYWDNHLLPLVGGLTASAVTRSDIMRAHRTIGEKAQVTANRSITMLNHFFSWAAGAGHVPRGHNPVEDIKRYKESLKERYLTADELARLGAAIRLAETDGIEWLPSNAINPKSKHAPKLPENRRSKISAQVAGAIRLLIFTGARLREVLNLEWTECDFDRGMLFLPDSKTGKKAVYVGAPAVAVLAGLHERAMTEIRAVSPKATKPLSRFVFPTEDGMRPRHDLNKPWRLIKRAADLHDLRLHDLRHTYASVGAGAGMGLPIIGKLLGHTNPKTTSRYAHLDADPLRRASNLIGASILNAMS